MNDVPRRLPAVSRLEHHVTRPRIGIPALKRLDVHRAQFPLPLATARERCLGVPQGSVWAAREFWAKQRTFRKPVELIDMERTRHIVEPTSSFGVSPAPHIVSPDARMAAGKALRDKIQREQ